MPCRPGDIYFIVASRLPPHAERRPRRRLAAALEAHYQAGLHEASRSARKEARPDGAHGHAAHARAPRRRSGDFGMASLIGVFTRGD